MSTEFSTLIAAELREGWRSREIRRAPAFRGLTFTQAGGRCTTVDCRTRVRWSYRGYSLDVWRSSRGGSGRLVWQAVDPVPGTKAHDRGDRADLCSWDALDALLEMLLEGRPMLPRLEVDPPPLPEGIARIVRVGGGL